MVDFSDFKLFLFLKHSALYCIHFKIILYAMIKLFFCWVVFSSLHRLFHIQLNICSSQVSPGDSAFQLWNSQFIKMLLKWLTSHFLEKRYIFNVWALQVLFFWLCLLRIREIKGITNSNNRVLNRNTISFFTYKYFLLQQIDPLGSFFFPSL